MLPLGSPFRALLSFWLGRISGVLLMVMVIVTQWVPLCQALQEWQECGYTQSSWQTVTQVQLSFVKGVRSISRFIFLLEVVLFVPAPFGERIILAPSYYLCSFNKDQLIVFMWLYFRALSGLFHWSGCLFLYWYCTVSIPTVVGIYAFSCCLCNLMESIFLG